MTEEIQEQVEVGAVFVRGYMKPGWFIWNNRKYAVEQVNYTWQDKSGEEIIYYFSVVSGATLYELSFYARKLKWILDKIYVEG